MPDPYGDAGDLLAYRLVAGQLVPHRMGEWLIVVKDGQEWLVLPTGVTVQLGPPPAPLPEAPWVIGWPPPDPIDWDAAGDDPVTMPWWLIPAVGGVFVAGWLLTLWLVGGEL